MEDEHSEKSSVPRATESANKPHDRELALAGERGQRSVKVQQGTLCREHFEVGNEAAIVAQLREPQHFVRGVAGALLGRFALAEHPGFDERILDLATGDEELLAKRGLGLISRGAGGGDLELAPTAIEQRHAERRANTPELTGAVERRGEIGAGDSASAGELNGGKARGLGRADLGRPRVELRLGGTEVRPALQQVRGHADRNCRPNH